LTFGELSRSVAFQHIGGMSRVVRPICSGLFFRSANNNSLGGRTMSRRKIGGAVGGSAALMIGSVAVLALVQSARADYTSTVFYQINGDDSGNSGETVDGLTVGSITTRSGPGRGVESAILWTLPSGAATNLTPTGFTSGEANSTDGTYQVGDGSGTATGGQTHALMWQGTAASIVDLNPTNFSFSIANGVGGGQEVGYGSMIGGSTTDAVVWTGTAANSAVDLNPAGGGYSTTIGEGTDGSQQVGYGIINNQNHALLWSGTAASLIDLNPSGDTFSQAFSVSHGQQAGAAGGNTTGNTIQAAIWSGTADSYVNLDALNLFDQTYALSTNGTQQVGYGNGDDGDSALLWSGTSDSMVNLQDLLPAGGDWEQSDAYFIDAQGNIFGTAFGEYGDVFGTFAVEWSPVAIPEPASLSLVAAGMLLLARRRAPATR
jgi:hypothetical protein